MCAGRIASATYLVVLLGIGEVFAEPCHITGPRYNLVGDTVRWSMAIQSSHSCVSGLRSANVAMEKVKVVSKPQSGQIALLGWGFRYSAAPDLEGKDAFILEITGKINNQSGSSTIEVTVVAARPKPPTSSPVARTAHIPTDATVVGNRRHLRGKMAANGWCSSALPHLGLV